MIVLDASATVELLRATPAGMAVARRIRAADGSVHAPHLLMVEAAYAFRRLEADGVVTSERAAAAIEHLAALPVSRHAHDPLLPRVWALRHNLTAYDAIYVALAEALDAPLITFDRGIERAGGHRARVEVPG